jgi:hypothetical protein
MRSVNAGIARCLGAVALLSLAGCRQLLDIPGDPKLVVPDEADATSPTDATVDKGPWSCLDHPPAKTTSKADAALVRVQACNFVSPKCSEPVTDFTAELCGKMDLDCTNPLQTSIKEINGAMEFAVPTRGVLGVGFDGYLRFTPPKANCTDEDTFGSVGPLVCALLGPDCDATVKDDPDCLFPTFLPALLFFNPAVTADIDKPIPVPLVPTREAQTLIAAAGGNFNPTTGVIFTTSVDCNGVPASNVALTIDKHQDVVTELYAQNGVISSTATVTDESGLGGYIGVPPGTAVIDGFLDTDAPGSKKIGEVGVNVEAFTISYTNLSPSQ